MIKKTLQTVIFSALVWSLTLAPTVNAALYNFGTLDVRPINQTESKTPEWFIEYLKPGEQKQQQIQISNFAKETKSLNIYVTDTAVNKNTQFYTKSYEENPEDITSWINLPTNEITLESGESKILSVNFRLPENAGVGLHTGAIIVRENKADMAIEKGVRIYLNVVGPAITSGNVANIQSTETASRYTINVQTQNRGTTDFTNTYKLKLKDIFGGTHSQITQESKTKPQTTGTTALSIEKPKYGLFNLTLSAREGETYVGTVLFIPFWIPLAALAMVFAISKRKKPILKRKKVFRWNSLRTYWNKISTPEFKKSIAYVCILTIISISTIAGAQIEGEQANAKVAQTSAASYELTIKWGSFRNTFHPYGSKKQWRGRIFFPNAKIKTTNLLHFERNDQAEIIGNKTSLRFNTITAEDNDGITILVEPTTGAVPIVYYENYDNNTEYKFLITDYLNSAGIYPDGIYATYFRTNYSQQEKLRQRAIRLSNLSELEASKELAATPPPAAQIPELENLFVEELPATKEVLSELILKSDYVERIVEENKVSKIDTDSILIKALKGTPDVLQEIVGSPDLNFIFIPSETINFPAREFSYDLDKNSEQDLGTMIFVQNKNTPWNTFISTTDFELLSGSAIIPASALTIDPGKPVILSEKNGATITGGKPTKLKGKTDKAPLVEVKPKTNKQDIFILNPKLTISIPRGTPAGTYRGQLIITSL